MKYRKYRIDCKEKKQKHLDSLRKNVKTAPVVGRNKMKPNSDKWDKYACRSEECDYVQKCGRTKYSSELKDMYNRKFRRSSKVNMTAFNGCSYKKVSGDFKWDYF